MRVPVVVVGNVAVVEAKERVEPPMHGDVLGRVVPHVPLADQFRRVPQIAQILRQDPHVKGKPSRLTPLYTFPLHTFAES